MIVSLNKGLVDVLTSKGPNTSIELGHALMCATLDIIAAWGFEFSTRAVESLAHSKHNDMVEVGPIS